MYFVHEMPAGKKKNKKPKGASRPILSRFMLYTTQHIGRCAMCILYTTDGGCVLYQQYDIH